MLVFPLSESDKAPDYMRTEQGCLIVYREAMARNLKMYIVRQDLINQMAYTHGYIFCPTFHGANKSGVYKPSVLDCYHAITKVCGGSLVYIINHCILKCVPSLKFDQKLVPTQKYDAYLILN